MAKQLIKRTNYSEIYKQTGMTKKGGCQCYKSDCGCWDDFKSVPYTTYIVKKINCNKFRTSYCKTLEEAEEIVRRREEDKAKNITHIKNNII